MNSVCIIDMDGNKQTTIKNPVSREWFGFDINIGNRRNQGVRIRLQLLVS